MDLLWSKQGKARTCGGFFQQDSSPAWRVDPACLPPPSPRTLNISVVQNALLLPHSTLTWWEALWDLELTAAILVLSIISCAVVLQWVTAWGCWSWVTLHPITTLHTHRETHMFRLPDRSSFLCKRFMCFSDNSTSLRNWWCHCGINLVLFSSFFLQFHKHVTNLSYKRH